MAKYLIVATYTNAGVKGVIAKGGTARRDAVSKMIDELGGQMESFYFGFGEGDAYVLADLPDNVTAAAIAMAVGAAGGATVNTTVLLTTEEVDRAAEISVDYVPPGG